MVTTIYGDFAMRETRKKITAPGVAVRFGMSLLILLAYPSHAAAAGLVPVRFIESKPSGEFGSRSQTDGEAGEVMALIRSREFDKALALATRMAQSRPSDPAGYNLQGIAHMGKQDWANARKSFEGALKISPDDTTALSNLAQIDIQQKNPAAAQKRYQALLAKDQNNVSAMLGLAQLEILKGDSNAVLAWFEKAKAARPEAVDPRVNIAAYHMRRANFKQAIQEMTDAARVLPGNAEILNVLGQAQLGDGQAKPATETFRKLVAARPDAPLAHYRLATAQIAANDASGAAQSLVKALQLNPKYVDAVMLLAALEIEAKRYAEALKLAKQVQSIQPGTAAGLVLEGDILMAQQRYGDATKAYELAQAKAPSSLVVVKLHGAQTKSGNAKLADANLNRWLEAHPDDILVLQFAATENSRKGDKKLAVKQHQRVLLKDPKNQVSLNNLAFLYHQTGDPRALQTAEAAYKLNQGSPVIADTLGWILVEQGNVARGLELLKAAAASSPGNPEIRYHLAVAWAKSGDKLKARRELEALLAREPSFAQRDAAQALLKQL